MATIQLKRGTAAAWTTANTVLLVGQPGVETDTHKWKVGDGSTAWNDLPYMLGGAVPAPVHAGYVALVAGVATVMVDWVTAKTIIVVSSQTTDTAAKSVAADPADIVPGVSFMIRSGDVSDTRSVFWMAREPTDNPPMALKVVVLAGQQTYPAANWVGVRKDFTGVDEAWLSFDLAYDDATIPLFLVPAGGPDPGVFGDTSNPLYNYFFPEHNGSNYWYLSSGTDAEATAPTIIGSTWFHIELHFWKDNVVDLYVDGTLRVTVPEGSGSPSEVIMLGNFQNGAVTGDSTTYFKDVKLGTTRGGHDLFADDFGSGGVTNWTSTMATAGTVTVVPIPYV
jgi:hypothetical protein